MGSRRVAMIWFWSSGGWRTHIGWQLVRITSNYNNKWNNITTRLRFTLVKLPPLMLEYSRTVMFNSSYIQIMLLLNHYSLCLKCSIVTIFRGKIKIIIKASLVLPPTFCHAILDTCSHEMGFRDNNICFHRTLHLVTFLNSHHSTMHTWRRWRPIARRNSMWWNRL